MRELLAVESEAVSGGVMSIFGPLAGACIGAATASNLLGHVQVYWLGLIPVPITIAGAFVGGAIGDLLYDLDQYIVQSTPSKQPVQLQA